MKSADERAKAKLDLETEVDCDEGDTDQKFYLAGDTEPIRWEDIQTTFINTDTSYLEFVIRFRLLMEGEDLYEAQLTIETEPVAVEGASGGEPGMVVVMA